MSAPEASNHISAPSTAPENEQYKPAFPLIDLDKLDISPSYRPMITAINIAVRKIMNNPPYDASHNYQHARRGVMNGVKILTLEFKTHQWARDVDPLVVILACLVHDIGDRKYRTEGDARDQETVLLDFLAGFECPDALRREVALLAASVSFTLSLEEPELVAAIARKYPAFGFIQDADRLDALGAIGLTRMHMFHGAHKVYKHGSIDQGAKLMEQRFGHYPGLMKTEAEERFEFKMGEWKARFASETEYSYV